ncbi:MAG: FHA domain-containing protein [Pseudomonadota bacterium]
MRRDDVATFSRRHSAADGQDEWEGAAHGDTDWVAIVSRVAVEVRDAAGARIAGGAFAPPFKIGRDPSCAIALPIDDTSASREHATVMERNGALFLEDHSSNGTFLNGRAHKGTALPFHERLEVVIGGSTVTLSVGKSLFVNVRGAFGGVITMDGAPKADAAIDLADAGLACTLTGGTPQFATLPFGAAPPADALFTITSTAGPTIERFSDNAEIFVRRHPMRDNRVALEPLDHINIGKVRIEILDPDIETIECSDISCRGLNKRADLNANCRWCGARLVGAGTVFIPRSF